MSPQNYVIPETQSDLDDLDLDALVAVYPLGEANLRPLAFAVATLLRQIPDGTITSAMLTGTVRDLLNQPDMWDLFLSSAETQVPRWRPIPVQIVGNGQMFSIDLSAFVRGSNPTITVTRLPPGVTESGGVISGSVTSVGDHTISLTATNSEGSANTSFVLRVGIPVPVWSNIAVQAAGNNAAFNLDLTALVSGNPTIAVSGLPTGLSATNGVISGQSTVTGFHTITATATNAGGSSQTTFVIEVEPAVAPQIGVPIWSAIEVGTWRTDQHSRLDLNEFVSGTSPIVITYSGLRRVSMGNRLAFRNGVIFTTRDTAGLFDGPRNGGDREVTVRATNALGSTDATFIIPIRAVGRPGSVGSGEVREAVAFWSEDEMRYHSFRRLTINLFNYTENTSRIEVIDSSRLPSWMRVDRTTPHIVTGIPPTPDNPPSSYSNGVFDSGGVQFRIYNDEGESATRGINIYAVAS